MTPSPPRIAVCPPLPRERRAPMLSGSGCSLSEPLCAYGGVHAEELMTVPERAPNSRLDDTGRYAESSHPTGRHRLKSDVIVAAQDGMGYWRCSLPDRMVYLDACCTALLEYDQATPLMKSMDEWRRRLHPRDRGTLRRYQRIFEQPNLGDFFADLIRLRLGNGNYTHMLIRGSVLERSPQGQALQLAGTLSCAVDMERSDERERLERARMLFALNASGDGLWDWDVAKGDIYFSSSYLAMLGHTPETCSGRVEFWRSIIHPDDAFKVDALLQPRLASSAHGDAFECSYRLRHADGHWIWILDRGFVTHRNGQGRATHMIGMHTDISNAQNDREHLEELVKNDSLTGLRSRTFLQLAIEEIEKSGTRPVSIIFCDVNGLKLINDYLGHAEGDKVLHRAAQLLRLPLRANDCVARTGGDEFIVVLSGCAEDCAAEILRRMEQHITEDNSTEDALPVLVSLGAATALSPDIPLSRTLEEADKRMLRVKAVHRETAHKRIKAWIERHRDICVSLEDDRCVG